MIKFCRQPKGCIDQTQVEAMKNGGNVFADWQNTSRECNLELLVRKISKPTSKRQNKSRTAAGTDVPNWTVE